MIYHISIENFATIENIDFDLEKGLNIITGETGSGKSVLISAISTILGARADSGMIRTGADKSKLGIALSLDGEDYIITREINSNGKSISKINGELVSLAEIKSFTAGKIDIHGQYDNQYLLNQDNHIFIVDSFNDTNFKDSLNKMEALYMDWKASYNQYISFLKNQESLQREYSFLKFESEYLNNLNLKDGEYETLLEELNFMKNSNKIYENLNEAYSLIHDSDTDILSSLSTAKDKLDSIASFHDDVKTISEELDEIYYNLDDISERLFKILSKIDFSEENIDEISLRLSKLEDAKRKYNMSIEKIIEYKQSIDAKLETNINSDEILSDLKAVMDKKYNLAMEHAEHLSLTRKENAVKLKKAINEELKSLNFTWHNFDIHFTKNTGLSNKGIDDIQFLMSTNPNDELKPLAKIASGGEISRIMLAFKHIIGDKDKTSTMIFDEIDTGISGNTAFVVGNKLKEISKHHQVIAITHLPQIASAGDYNFNIVKDITNNSVFTNILSLNDEEKIKVVANLMSGDDSDSDALNASKTLINRFKS